LVGSAVLAFLSTLGGIAAAQTLPSVDARTWQPSTDANANLVTEPVGTPGMWRWNVAGLLRYENHPFTLRFAGSDSVAYRPIEHLFGLDVVAGMGIGKIGAVGVSIPMVIYQDGSNGMPSTIATSGSVPATALGDVGIHGKATILANEDKLAGFGLAALGLVTVPTGDRASFLGDGSTTATARLLAEYKYVVARVQASLGYTLRTDHHTWPAASVGGVTFGDQIPWTFGVNLRPGILSKAIDEDDRQTWEIAAHGWLPAGPVGPFGTGDPGSAKLSPVLLAISDRVEIGHDHDVYAIGGVDIGLDTAAGVPAARIIAGIGWAPRPHDRDGDGVADDIDECPDLAEDPDGKQDGDGCPEDDADADGVMDDQDACPLVPGVWQNDPLKNGCPAPDSDKDGIADPLDACPMIPGVFSSDPAKNGCPRVGDWRKRDADRDKIPDRFDACPRERGTAHDDAHKNGCPVRDADRDGIPDEQDACPREAGSASTDPLRHGCKHPDRDHDSYPDEVDECPDNAEVWNGVKDEDGCPDDGGKPLVVVDLKDPKHPTIAVVKPLAFKAGGDPTKPELDAASVMTLRALATEEDKHEDWTIGVGVRSGAGRQETARAIALAQADVVARWLNALVYRNNAAEVVQWDAAKQEPGATSGIAFLVLLSPIPPPPPGKTP
jgi:hypothetical protein